MIANLLHSWIGAAAIALHGVITDETIRNLGQPTSGAPAAPAAPEELNYAMLALRMALALLFVLGLALAVALIVRRYFPQSRLGAGRLEKIDLLATRHLGGRSALILARVHGRVVLLGATPQQISFLSEWEDDEEWHAEPAGEAEAAAPRSPAVRAFESFAEAARRSAETKPRKPFSAGRETDAD